MATMPCFRREWDFFNGEWVSLGNYWFGWGDPVYYYQLVVPFSIGLYEPNEFEFTVYVLYFYIGECRYDAWPDTSCSYYAVETVLGYSSVDMFDASSYYSMVSCAGCLSYEVI